MKFEKQNQEQDEEESSLMEKVSHVSFEGSVSEDDENRKLYSSILTAEAKSSTFQAFFTLCKSFIGSGVLTLAFSFKNAGAGISIILTIFIGILTYHCTMLILDVADAKSGKKEKMSYSRIAFDELRKFGMYSVEVSLIVMQIGVCIGIFILANKFFEHTFCIYNVSELCGNRVFTVILCALLTIPLCFINNMHYFYIPNLAGFAFLVIALLTQLFHCFKSWDSEVSAGLGVWEALTTVNLEKLPLLFGVAIYAFEGIGPIFDIRDSMQKPKEFPVIMKINTIFLLIVYTVFPLACVLTINKIPEIVLFSLPKDSTLYLLVQVGYVFSGLLGFPTQFYPAIQIIENSKYLKNSLFDDKGNTKNSFLRYGLRIFIVCILLIIANITKSFNLFLNFLGSCVFTYVGYLLPIWIYNSYFRDTTKPSKKYLNWACFTFGLFFGVSGMIISFIELIKYKEQSV